MDCDCFEFLSACQIDRFVEAFRAVLRSRSILLRSLQTLSKDSSLAVQVKHWMYIIQIESFNMRSQHEYFAVAPLC